ncbi:MAG: immunity 52 family protein [Alphaproteobacteria bacterium]|nr:immunity 52 family protein [Alphaproteobacteria bacterium]
MSNLTVHCWWGPRQETLGACAERGADLLRRLQPLHPAYARWYEKGNSRKQAMECPVDDLTALRLLPLLAEKKGQPSDATSRFGFSFGLWNGAETDEASVGVRSTAGMRGKRFMWNSAEVGLPDEGVPEPVTTPEGGKPILAAVIAAYEPQWGVLSNQKLLYPNRDLRLPQSPFLSWMTWLRGPASPAGGPVDGLGDDATVEPFEGGALITLGQRPMHHDNPEDIARIRDAWLKLREAGYPL